jgi:hypothetical protein
VARIGKPILARESVSYARLSIYGYEKQGKELGCREGPFPFCDPVHNWQTLMRPKRAKTSKPQISMRELCSQSLLCHLVTSDSERVPIREPARCAGRVQIALLVLLSFFLRIFPIKNLEPSAVLSLRDVRCSFVLGDDSLQVQLTDTRKKPYRAALLDEFLSLRITLVTRDGY